MKPLQYFLSIIVIVALSTTTHAQSGNYAGSLTEQNLHFYFQIQKDSAGNYNGDWSSLTQRAFGLNLKKVEVKGDSLTFGTTGANATFRLPTHPQTPRKTANTTASISLSDRRSRI